MRFFACSFFTLFKTEVFSFAASPFSFAGALAFCVFCSAGFFAQTKFFAQSGGSLSHFFLLMSYVSCAYIPALCLGKTGHDFERSLPYSSRLLFFSRGAAALAIFCLTLFLTAPVPLCSVLFFRVDWGTVFCAYFGMIFFAATAIFLCVFLSEFFKNRAAAFFACVLAMSAANSVHLLSSAFALPDFVAAAVREVSFAWRFDSALKGVFDSRDFVFFAVFASFFLELAVFVRESGKGKNYFSKKRESENFLKGEFFFEKGAFLKNEIPSQKDSNEKSFQNEKNPLGERAIFQKFPFRKKEARHAAFRARFSPSPLLNTICFLLAVFFLLADSKKIYFRADFSREKRHSLSPYTKALLEDAGEKIRVSYCRTSRLLSLYPQAREVSFFLQSMAAQCPNVFYCEFDPARRGEEARLVQMGCRPYQIQVAGPKGSEYADVFSSIVIECLDRTAVIPLCLSAATLEFDIAQRMNLLLEKKARKCYVLRGGGQDAGEYGILQEWLYAEGFEAEPFFDADFLDFASSDFPLLLLGTGTLDENDVLAVEGFLLRGGRALVTTSPYFANAGGGWEVCKNAGDAFLALLEKWGLSFESALVADTACVRARFYSAKGGSGSERFEYVDYPFWASAKSFASESQKQNDFFSESGSKAWKQGANFFWASPIICGEAAEPIFLSSENSWIVMEDFDNFSAEKSLFLTNPFFVPESFEQCAKKGVFAKKQRSVLGARAFSFGQGPYENPHRITLLSGEHFASDILLTLAGGDAGDFRNLNFLSAELFRLSGNAALAELKNKPAPSAGLENIANEADYAAAARAAVLANFVFVPCAVFAFWAALFFWRKKRKVFFSND